MVGKVLKGLVQGRFIPVAFGDGSPEIIRNYRRRNAPDVMKGVLTSQDQRGRPCGLLLTDS